MAFDEWLAKQPHAHKLVIIGNHEVGLFAEFNPKLITNA